MTSSTPPILLSSEDFPALAPSTSDTVSVTQVVDSPSVQELSVVTSNKSQEKADRKAAKKAAAAEKGKREAENRP